MDIYKPIMSKAELKGICTEAQALHDTPLRQARYAINVIDYIRQKHKPTKISREERESIRLVRRSLGLKPWEKLDEDLQSESDWTEP